MTGYYYYEYECGGHGRWLDHSFPGGEAPTARGWCLDRWRGNTVHLHGRVRPDGRAT